MTNAKKPPRYIRSPEVVERTGLCRTTIWRLTKEGDFPAKRRLYGNVVGWLESEVEDWIASRPIVPPDEEAVGSETVTIFTASALTGHPVETIRTWAVKFGLAIEDGRVDVESLRRAVRDNAVKGPSDG